MRVACAAAVRMRRLASLRPPPGCGDHRSGGWSRRLVALIQPIRRCLRLRSRVYAAGGAPGGLAALCGPPPLPLASAQTCLGVQGMRARSKFRPSRPGGWPGARARAAKARAFSGSPSPQYSSPRQGQDERASRGIGPALTRRAGSVACGPSGPLAASCGEPPQPEKARRSRSRGRWRASRGSGPPWNASPPAAYSVRLYRPEVSPHSLPALSPRWGKRGREARCGEGPAGPRRRVLLLAALSGGPPGV